MFRVLLTVLTFIVVMALLVGLYVSFLSYMQAQVVA